MNSCGYWNHPECCVSWLPETESLGSGSSDRITNILSSCALPVRLFCQPRGTVTRLPLPCVPQACSSLPGSPWTKSSLSQDFCFFFSLVHLFTHACIHAFAIYWLLPTCLVCNMQQWTKGANISDLMEPKFSLRIKAGREKSKNNPTHSSVGDNRGRKWRRRGNQSKPLVRGRRSSYLKQAGLGHPREMTTWARWEWGRGEQAPGLARGGAFEVEGAGAPWSKGHLEEPYRRVLARTRWGPVRAWLRVGMRALSHFLPLLFSSMLAKWSFILFKTFFEKYKLFSKAVEEM